MEDELRAAEVSQDVRDAILGHATKSMARLYGVGGEALKRLAGRCSGGGAGRAQGNER